MTDETIMELDDENDFGFTFVSEDELAPTSDVDELKRRLREVNKLFMPLLVNLNKNPEKEMIKWPNRKAILDKQIKRLEDLTRT